MTTADAAPQADMAQLVNRLEEMGTSFSGEPLSKGIDEVEAAGEQMHEAAKAVDELVKELASYKRMFMDACSSLGLIDEALGIDPDESGGAEPILDAIEELKSKPGPAVMSTIEAAALTCEREASKPSLLHDADSWRDGCNWCAAEIRSMSAAALAAVESDWKAIPVTSSSADEPVAHFVETSPGVWEQVAPEYHGDIDVIPLFRGVPAAVTGWHPIATAPKDGKRFLGDMGGKVGFFHWQDFADGSDAPIGWRDDFIIVYKEGTGPTRWMPIPATSCDTCNGHGMIGGPSYSAPDEGGEPCPDCNAPAAPVAVPVDASHTKAVALPKFITFTGADDETSLEGMAELSAKYPIEWGILFSPKRQGTGRYPSLEFVKKLVAVPSLTLSAHLCGGDSRQVLEGFRSQHDDLLSTRFSRSQINSAAGNIDHLGVRKWADSVSVTPILQCRDGFPSEASVQWLFDKSGGRGIAPAAWPAPASETLTGYAGGLNPENVSSAVAAIGKISKNYWIDMESGVRDESDRFDLSLCRAVCEAVYGVKAAAPAPHSGEAAPTVVENIRFDFVNSDGREDSKVISHDEMRERYASVRDQLYSIRLTIDEAGAAMGKTVAYLNDLGHEQKLSFVPIEGAYEHQALILAHAARPKATVGEAGGVVGDVEIRELIVRLSNVANHSATHGDRGAARDGVRMIAKLADSLAAQPQAAPTVDGQNKRPSEAEILHISRFPLRHSAILDSAVIELANALFAAQPQAPIGEAAAVGEVVVATNHKGQIIAVTRQDEDGKVLSVIATSECVNEAGEVVAEPIGWITSVRGYNENSLDGDPSVVTTEFHQYQNCPIPDVGKRFDVFAAQPQAAPRNEQICAIGAAASLCESTNHGVIAKHMREFLASCETLAAPSMTQSADDVTINAVTGEMTYSVVLSSDRMRELSREALDEGFSGGFYEETLTRLIGRAIAEAQLTEKKA